MLLDLTDIYDTTVEVLSTVFIVGCVAGTFGSFLCTVLFGYIYLKNGNQFCWAFQLDI